MAISEPSTPKQVKSKRSKIKAILCLPMVDWSTRARSHSISRLCARCVGKKRGLLRCRSSNWPTSNMSTCGRGEMASACSRLSASTCWRYESGRIDNIAEENADRSSLRQVGATGRCPQAACVSRRKANGAQGAGVSANTPGSLTVRSPGWHTRMAKCISRGKPPW